MSKLTSLGMTPYRGSRLRGKLSWTFLIALLLVGLSVATSAAELWINEVKVNPPGTNDTASEFIELSGSPGTVLSNVVLLAVTGDDGSDPGKVTYVLRLDGVSIGTNGLLLISPTNAPYPQSPGTSVWEDPQLSRPGGALGNGSLSFFVLTTRVVLDLGDDLDKGDNGVLEGLPADATIHDSIGWSDGDKNDHVYALAVLALDSAAPDAAARLPGNTTPNDPSAWLHGELLGTDPLGLEFDSEAVSASFPSWTLLTPGRPNNSAPRIAGPEPVSGVIGDPGNPKLLFRAEGFAAGGDPLLAIIESDNPQVVPSTNLLVSAISPGTWEVTADPVGVGYATLTLSVSDGSVTGRVALPYAASAAGKPGTVWYSGACDGSTAISFDTGSLFLGDDENQTIRLYQRGTSGLPLQLYDMSGYLGLLDYNSEMPREVDVEASTRVGNRLYWIGSHGHGADGEARTNRTRIFATDIVAGSSPPGLAYVGRYDYLKTDLIAWDSLNLHGKGTNYYGIEASDADGVPPKAPDGSGLSIEGLAMAGSAKAAYIAFRAPIVPATNRTYALLIPVLNFTDVVDTSAPPGSCVFGPPIELDLYNRGVRSIEGSTSGFIIIGGPAAAATGPYPADFRLYTWTGLPADQPQQRTADLSGLNPEGLVGLPPEPWNPASILEILSDCGAVVYYGDDIPAKRLELRNFKKSRSDLVHLGEAVKPAPIITAVARTGDVLRLRWRSLRGEQYFVQAQGAGEPGLWSDIGSVHANGPYSEAMIPIAATWELLRIRIANAP